MRPADSPRLGCRPGSRTAPPAATRCRTRSGSPARVASAGRSTPSWPTLRTIEGRGPPGTAVARAHAAPGRALVAAGRGADQVGRRVHGQQEGRARRPAEVEVGQQVAELRGLLPDAWPGV